MTILQTADLKKYYGQGTNLTKALDGVDLSVEQGGIPGGGGGPAAAENPPCFI